MKYSEFEELVKEVGLKVEYNDNYAMVRNRGITYLSVSINTTAIISIVGQRDFEGLSKDVRLKLIEAMSALANTELEDRKDVQTYLVPLCCSGDNYTTILCRDLDKNGNYFITSRKLRNSDLVSIWLSRSDLVFFTEEEIKKHNKFLYPNFVINSKDLKTVFKNGVLRKW